MGIPGLTGKAKKLKKYQNHRSLIKGSDVYIDGLNLSTLQGEHADMLYKFLPDPEAELRLAEVLLNGLLDLEPNSLTFVVDAMIGEEKFEVRKQRGLDELVRREKKIRISSELTLLAMKTPGVMFVYSGTEAEDEIMKMIDEDHGRADRRQYVITSDSDAFRFNIRDAQMVEVIQVPDFLNLVFKSRVFFTSINLKRVLCSNIVKKSDVINAPIERLGASFVNPTKPCRNYLELINCGHIYGRIFVFRGSPTHQASLIRKEAPPVQLAGTLLRQLAYGIIISRHFSGQASFNSEYVTEWLLHQGTIDRRQVSPLSAENISPLLRLLKNMTFLEIVEHQLRAATKDQQFSEVEIQKSLEAVKTALLRKERMEKSDTEVTDGRAVELYSLVRSIISSYSLLAQCIVTDLHEHWSSSPINKFLRRNLKVEEFL